MRRWEREGRLVPDGRTRGGDRRYDLNRLGSEPQGSDNPDRKTVAYARVSSPDQKDDLDRQKQVLELYCARQGWTFEVIADLGSGMNYHKKGLKRLLNDILADRIGRLVVIHKDRLLRLGAELVFAICEAQHVEVLILNQGEDTTCEEELAPDVLEIITVFSARLYGSRSRKNQKLLDGVKHTVQEASSRFSPIKLPSTPTMSRRRISARRRELRGFPTTGLSQNGRSNMMRGKPIHPCRNPPNAIKGDQFPWMLEVTKNAPQMAIRHLGQAFKNFFAG